MSSTGSSSERGLRLWLSLGMFALTLLVVAVAVGALRPEGEPSGLPQSTATATGPVGSETPPMSAEPTPNETESSFEAGEYLDSACADQFRVIADEAARNKYDSPDLGAYLESILNKTPIRGSAFPFETGLGYGFKAAQVWQSPAAINPETHDGARRRGSVWFRRMVSELATLGLPSCDVLLDHLEGI